MHRVQESKIGDTQNAWVRSGAGNSQIVPCVWHLHSVCHSVALEVGQCSVNNAERWLQLTSHYIIQNGTVEAVCRCSIIWITMYTLSALAVLLWIDDCVT